MKSLKIVWAFADLFILALAYFQKMDGFTSCIALLLINALLHEQAIIIKEGGLHE